MNSLFVYEFTCARRPETGSLPMEGWAMLSAVLADLTRIDGMSVVTLLNEGFPHQPIDVFTRRIDRESEEEVFRELVCSTDATLVIAPEFDGILLQRCRWVEEESRPLLGSSSLAVALTSDKLLLSRHLAAHGIATPECLSFDQFPMIVKPRDGAGSQATFLVHTPQELVQANAIARSEGWNGEWIRQPFVAGQPVSVAFLLGAHEEYALPAATQELTTDSRFRYRGGTVPLSSDLAGRATNAARRAIRTVPGLAGFVGVDLVLGDGCDWVIEINPRLTTSYVGLRRLSLDNLAEAMIRAVRGKVVSLCWRQERIHFSADGTVHGS